MTDARQPAQVAAEEAKAEAVSALKLTMALTAVPADVFAHGAALTQLDLSGTGLSVLPDSFGAALPQLRVLFLSNNAFTEFPRALAHCPALEMVAFRGNGMRRVPEDALPPRLRWLILTNNALEALPASIGRCARLQKCLLAGNRLATLPPEMAQCRRLGLLRLSANRFESLPDWLFDLPELAFLSFAGNPCAATMGKDDDDGGDGLPQIPLASLDVQTVLGEGASGVISQGLWTPGPGRDPVAVAIKRFRGAVTSDGTPRDEMRACLRAGPHAHLIDPLGVVIDNDKNDGETEKEWPSSSSSSPGLVLQLVPPRYRALGLPPSLASCTRDTFPAGATPALSLAGALAVLAGVAAAARHLHARGVAHGDLYAHNVLVDPATGHALLGDLGAASLYHDDDDENATPSSLLPNRFERLDVLAFGHLLEDVWHVARPQLRFGGFGDVAASARLEALHRRCVAAAPVSRPGFGCVIAELEEIRQMLLRPGNDDEEDGMGGVEEERIWAGEVVSVPA